MAKECCSQACPATGAGERIGFGERLIILFLFLAVSLTFKDSCAPEARFAVQLKGPFIHSQQISSAEERTRSQSLLFFRFQV